MKKFNFIILCVPQEDSEQDDFFDEQLDELLSDSPEAAIWDATTKNFNKVISHIRKEYGIGVKK